MLDTIPGAHFSHIFLSFIILVANMYTFIESLITMVLNCI